MDTQPLLNLPAKPSTIEECWVLIEQLFKITQEQLKIIEELKERLNSNSNNSSVPPSQSRQKKKGSSKKSHRKQGGQEGHKGVSRKLVSIEQVDEMIPCYPAEHCDCGGVLGEFKLKGRHQVYEIPEVRYQIKEYQIHEGCCPSCQKTIKGSLPVGVGKRGFGLRVHSLLSICVTEYRMSRRQAQKFLKAIFGLPISVGCVSNTEARSSQALAPVYENIETRLKQSEIVHLDETGFRQENRSGWAWIKVNQEATYFKLDFSRGKKLAQSLIGGIPFLVVTDRYPAYDYLPQEHHQVCWAHLKRDFKRISERVASAGLIGRALLKAYGRLFAFIHSGHQERWLFEKKSKKRLRRIKNQLLSALKAGTQNGHLKTQRTCQKILDCGASLWRFLEIPLAPATNNLAERQLRPLVIAKKLSFGTQSNRGSRFIERTFSVMMTCQQQGKSFFAFIQKALQAHFTGLESPKLFLEPAT